MKVELNDFDTEVIDTQTSDSISLDISEAGSEPGPSTSIAKNGSSTTASKLNVIQLELNI